MPLTLKRTSRVDRPLGTWTVDRATGKNVVTADYAKTNWSKGIDKNGIPNPAKEPQLDGALVTPNQGGAANWPPPSYSPDTGLFDVSASRAFSVWYIHDPSDKPEGWGGNDRGGWGEAMIDAIDYKTGKVKWSHKCEDGGRSGLLPTTGKLLFAGDGWGQPRGARSGEREGAPELRLSGSWSEGDFAKFSGRPVMIPLYMDKVPMPRKRCRCILSIRNGFRRDCPFTRECPAME